ncbi:tetratricopeptide repeat protein [Aquiflexum sp.]|uniref:tetratricopeptide repeat protein n=1 Tax=Aquiflexum sp. TaxID=1872584 RepID=UPI0035942581
MRVSHFYLALIFLVFSSCQSDRAQKRAEKNNYVASNEEVFQGMGLLGDSLITSVDSVSQGEQIKKLHEAEAEFDENPNLDNLIWIGRREGYLARYDLAIRTFSKAIKEYPKAFEPLRHRGHRYISTREFDNAIADFVKAVDLMKGTDLKIEQDGMPNKLNIPLSNVQFNVWYHLGLAYYLKGDWENALEAYKNCLTVSDNDDLIIATLDWYYMTLVKLGRKDEALKIIESVNPKMTIIENDAYFKRILMYQGRLSPESLLNVKSGKTDQSLQYVTQGYGLGNHYLAKGDTVMAITVFENVLKSGNWSAFGYIASEMELSKLAK